MAAKKEGNLGRTLKRVVCEWERSGFSSKNPCKKINTHTSVRMASRAPSSATLPKRALVGQDLRREKLHNFNSGLEKVFDNATAWGGSRPTFRMPKMLSLSYGFCKGAPEGTLNKNSILVCIFPWIFPCTAVKNKL